MSVDFQCAGVLGEWHVAIELRANLDGNLQEHTLGAARFGGTDGTVAALGRHCQFSVAVQET